MISLMVVARRALTLDAFLRLPEEEPALEFEDGEVIQKVSPKLRHSKLQRRLLDCLDARAGDEYDALPELRCTFGGRSLVPDVALVRHGRFPVDAAGEFEEDVQVAPDAAIEIVSPDQSVPRLLRRCLWYVENDVRVAILVDPSDHTLFVFRQGAPMQALHGDAVLDLTDLSPSLTLPLSEIFSALRPS